MTANEMPREVFVYPLPNLYGEAISIDGVWTIRPTKLTHSYTRTDLAEPEKAALQDKLEEVKRDAEVFALSAGSKAYFLQSDLAAAKAECERLRQVIRRAWDKRDIPNQPALILAEVLFPDALLDVDDVDWAKREIEDIEADRQALATKGEPNG